MSDDERSPSSRRLAAAAEQGIDLRVAPARSDFTDWDLDQQVRRVQARADSWRRVDPAAATATLPSFIQRPAPAPQQPSPQRRFDGPHASSGRHASSRMPRSRRSSTLGWCLLWLGLMAFACGVALLIQSWLESRGELWSLGVPIAIGGQIGLLLGLVLQLERIWHNSHTTVLQLEQVDVQLRQLERAAADWTAPQGTAAQAFGTAADQ